MRLFLFVGIGIAGLISLVAFDPISMLALRIGSLLVGTATIYLVILTTNMIRDWLRQNRPLYKDALAFAVKQEMANGNIRVVTGFFDIEEKIEEKAVKNSQVYESEQLDPELERILSTNNQIVVFT